MGRKESNQTKQNKTDYTANVDLQAYTKGTVFKISFGDLDFRFMLGNLVLWLCVSVAVKSVFLPSLKIGK